VNRVRFRKRNNPRGQTALVSCNEEALGGPQEKEILVVSKPSLQFEGPSGPSHSNDPGIFSPSNGGTSHMMPKQMRESRSQEASPEARIVETMRASNAFQVKDGASYQLPNTLNLN
jgi:hypothetical protein